MIPEKDFRISVTLLAVTSSRFTTTVSIVEKSAYNGGDKQDISDILFSQACKNWEKRPKSPAGIEPSEQYMSFYILVRCSTTELSLVFIHQKNPGWWAFSLFPDDPRHVWFTEHNDVAFPLCGIVWNSLENRKHFYFAVDSQASARTSYHSRLTIKMTWGICNMFISFSIKSWCWVQVSKQSLCQSISLSLSSMFLTLLSKTSYIWDHQETFEKQAQSLRQNCWIMYVMMWKVFKFEKLLCIHTTVVF